MLVGKSTHSLNKRRRRAEGADYIGFGPLFATPTKPDYSPLGLDDIREVHERVPHSDFLHRRNQTGKSRAGDRRRRETRRHRLGLAARRTTLQKYARAAKSCCIEI